MVPASDRTRLPSWFRTGLSTGARYRQVRALVREQGLHTVCESAACPNRNECWNDGTATFLILGNTCTRNCGFCNIGHGRPLPPDPGEPLRVAEAVRALGLEHAVITSVTRDDLPDGGAEAFAAVIDSIRARAPRCRVEVLIPDLRGDAAALDRVLLARPDILNHNIETVRSLYPRVRPQADYDRSVSVLRRAKQKGTVTKSGLMLGLGERREEVIAAFEDLQAAGCDMVVIGQYLMPGRNALPVARYYDPAEFDALRGGALAAGIPFVLAGPRARSSYHAGRCRIPS